MLLPFRDEFGAAVIGSAGIDQAQRITGRMARTVAAMADHQSQSLSGLGDRSTVADTMPAQQFRPSPPPPDASAVGVEAFPHLPGPMPTAGWDGEAGASQPEWTRP